MTISYTMEKIRKLSLLLLLLFAGFMVTAQQPFVVLSGHITQEQTGEPMPWYPVYISTDSLNFPGYFSEVFTDASGFYSDSIPYTSGAVTFINVTTPNCDGGLISQVVTFIPGVQQLTVDFSICSNGSSSCYASFRYLPASNDMLSISFFDESYAAPGSVINSWSWDFGDGNYSFEQNPVHTYAEAGHYLVTLNISGSDSSCFSGITLPVDAGYVLPGGCENYFHYYPDPTGAFTFEGFVFNGSADSYTWDFGDGTTATGQTVSHQFASNDTIYTVCLTTTGMGPDGMPCTSVSCQEVFFYTPDPCESTFWYYCDSTGTGFIFEGWSFAGNPETWTWDFGDGTTATGQIVSHTFANPNEFYNVCLTTTGTGPDGQTCEYTSCQEVFIYVPDPCESYFWYYPEPAGNSFTFEGWSMNNNVDSWTWDFGDGTTATGQTVTHIFAGTNQVYNVCLTTTGTGPDGSSCTYTYCQEVFTYISSPCENFFYATSNDGETYEFTGYLLNGENAEFFWDFGDGTTATGQVVTHTFASGQQNVYNVCLTTYLLNTPDSCYSTSCQMIFTGSGSGCQAIMSATPDSSGYTWSFADLSVGSSFRMWDFGDGNQSTEANPVHTYAEPGIYFACLMVGDSLNNCWDQTCQEIWVDLIQPECQASFFAFPADSSANSLTYQFINTSFPGYTSVTWDFGDGTSSDELFPVHTYAEAGIYVACLTIENGTSCSSTFCLTIFAGTTGGDYTIAGDVTAGNALAETGMVWLIGANNFYFAETLIESNGTYNFGGVPAGSYYIYAMLTPDAAGFADYLPTYYQNSLTWQGATIVTTADSSGWYSVNLVPASTLNQGNASITGTIFWTGTFKSGGTPAANVEIVLFNSTGLPVAYTFSHNDGSFAFENLPYGEYTVHAEMAGKQTQVMVVMLSDETSNASVDFVISATEINALGRDENNLPKLEAGNVFPNPVTDALYLELNAALSGKASAEILDLQGRIILSQELSLAGGNNRISINSSNLSKGIYILRITASGYQPVQRKFVK